MEILEFRDLKSIFRCKKDSVKNQGRTAIIEIFNSIGSNIFDIKYPFF